MNLQENIHRIQSMMGIIKESKDKDLSDTLFVMKSPYCPKGWDYDHIGFVLTDGTMKDMSGHRYTKDGVKPLPPIKYRFEDTEELFNMSKSKLDAKEQGLYDEVKLPKVVEVPNEIVCNIKNKRAVNCGSFVKIILLNNGIKTTKSNRPDDIFYSI